MPSHSSDEEDSRGNDDDGGPRWVVKSKATGKNLTRLTLKKKGAVEVGEGSGTDGSRVGVVEASDILSASQSPKEIDADASLLLELLNYDFEIDFNVQGEEGILFYIAGFISRSEMKKVNNEVND